MKAAQAFLRLMDTVLQNLGSAIVYLDDTFMASKKERANKPMDNRMPPMSNNLNPNPCVSII